MTIAGNKETVRNFFELFTEANVEGALDLLDDNVVWQVMGREGELPLSGEMDRAGIGELIKMVKATIPAGLQFTMNGWTCEGERVALEMECFGEKVNGVVYNNLYHFLIIIRDGKITNLREYMDTVHTRKVFIEDEN